MFLPNEVILRQTGTRHRDFPGLGNARELPSDRLREGWASVISSELAAKFQFPIVLRGGALEEWRRALSHVCSEFSVRQALCCFLGCLFLSRRRDSVLLCLSIITSSLPSVLPS